MILTSSSSWSGMIGGPFPAGGLLSIRLPKPLIASAEALLKPIHRFFERFEGLRVLVHVAQFDNLLSVKRVARDAVPNRSFATKTEGSEKFMRLQNDIGSHYGTDVANKRYDLQNGRGVQEWSAQGLRNCFLSLIPGRPG